MLMLQLSDDVISTQQLYIGNWKVFHMPLSSLILILKMFTEWQDVKDYTDNCINLNKVSLISIQLM